MGKGKASNYLEIKQKLIQKLGSEKYEDNKLPSEAALAKALDISLVTLRESLMMMALEGYITKRHGVGNFVHPSAFDPTGRVDMGITFRECFRQQGKEPGLKVIRTGEALADAEEAALFGVEKDAGIAFCEILYMADGLPCIYSFQRIPKIHLSSPVKLGVEQGDFYQFLNDFCEESITHSLNTYKAVLAHDKVAKALEIPEYSPLILCRQEYYNIQDRPIFFNEHYFHPERYGVRLLQNWDMVD